MPLGSKRVARKGGVLLSSEGGGLAGQLPEVTGV